MVNHLRTLLLNRSASYFDGIPMSEYIDPAYTPILLPADFQSVRNILIPNGIDKSTENYIASMLMTIAHQPELDYYTLLPDPRLTYDSRNISIADLVNPNIRLSTSKSSACDLDFKYAIDICGIPKTIGQSGRHIWYLSNYSTDTIKITGTRTGERLVVVTDPMQPHMSKRIELINGYLSAYMLMPSGNLTGTFIATYDTLIAAPYNMPVLLEQFHTALAGIAHNLFVSQSGYTTELKSLFAAYVNSPEAVLRLGCLIVAYLLQCDLLLHRVRN